MIIDQLDNATRYRSIHPLFATAFEYLKSLDLSNLTTGKFEVQGSEIKSIISEGTGVTKEDSVSKFECHNKHIDIQLLVEGSESFGWRSRLSCTEPKGDYNPEIDVIFYNDQPDMFFTLKPKQFVVFFPEDVHAPQISSGIIRKVVVKIKV